MTRPAPCPPRILEVSLLLDHWFFAGADLQAGFGYLGTLGRPEGTEQLSSVRLPGSGNQFELTLRTDHWHPSQVDHLGYSAVYATTVTFGPFQASDPIAALNEIRNWDCPEVPDVASFLAEHGDRLPDREPRWSFVQHPDTWRLTDDDEFGSLLVYPARRAGASAPEPWLVPHHFLPGDVVTVSGGDERQQHGAARETLDADRIAELTRAARWGQVRHVAGSGQCERC